MLQEGLRHSAEEEEKNRVLSTSPLTAVFLKGNPKDPEWAVSVFRESDYIIANIIAAVREIDTRRWVGMTKDQGNVLLSIGYELGNARNIDMFQQEILERTVQLQWIDPEELKKSGRLTSEGLVWTYLFSGTVYNICVEIFSATDASG